MVGFIWVMWLNAMKPLLDHFLVFCNFCFFFNFF